MKFATRFSHAHSKEDVSYYVAGLGAPTLFDNATTRLYFAVSRLQFTRIGPTMRAEILSEEEAQTEIAHLRSVPEWQELETPAE